MQARLLIILILTTATLCLAQEGTQPNAPERELIAEQIKNQKAQAAYYQKQIAGNSLWQSFLGALTSAIGTFIGAGLALIGVRWSSNRQWDLEQKKWLQAKEDEAAKEIKSAVAVLAQRMAAEIQAIIWLTWIAEFQPAMLTEKEISGYDREMKSLMSQDVAAQAALAAVNAELHSRIKPFVKEVSSLDHRMSFVVLKIGQAAEGSQEREEAIMDLGNFYYEAYDLYETLPEKLGTILKSKGPAADSR